MWGRAKQADRRPELERLAAEVERIFLAMPVDDRALAIDTIKAMARVGADLRVIPDELGAEIGKLLWRIFTEVNLPSVPGFGRRASPRAIVDQILAGAPTLLGPHRDEIEILLMGVH